MYFNIDGDVPYWYLAGIVSFGAKDCGMDGVPGVYTRTSSFLKWIDSKL